MASQDATSLAPRVRALGRNEIRRLNVKVDACLRSGDRAGARQVLEAALFTNHQQEERRLARAGSAGIVALAAAALVFEQGPFNEALRTKVGTDVLQSTQNALAVAGTVAVLTLAIEVIASALFAFGVAVHQDRVIRLISRGRERPSAHRPGRRGIVSDIGLALAVGAAVVVARKHLIDPGRAFKADIGTCLKASGAIAVISGLIGYLAAGGIQNARAVGLERPAQWFVDYATDWRFWAVVILAVYAPSGVRRVLSRWMGSNQLGR